MRGQPHDGQQKKETNCYLKIILLFNINLYCHPMRLFCPFLPAFFIFLPFLPCSLPSSLPSFLNFLLPFLPSFLPSFLPLAFFIGFVPWLLTHLGFLPIFLCYLSLRFSSLHPSSARFILPLSPLIMNVFHECSSC